MQVRRMLARRRGWVLAGLVAVALVVSGAVVATVDTMDRDGSRNETATVSQDAAAPAVASSAGSTVSPEASAARAQAAPTSPLPSPVPPDGGGTAVVPGAPRVVRTADLRIEVTKGGFAAAFDRVASIATAGGGFVSASSTASDEGARSGELTVRVPSDRFESVRQSLSGLGKLEGQSIRGEDVSGQLVDYDARLKSLQAQEESLRVLVGQAKEVGDVLRVQSSLFSVRQQIEQLQAQRANLEQSVNLATIQVSLFEPGAPSFRPGDDGPSLARSFERAVDGMVAVVGGMIVVVGYLVPIAVLGLLVWVTSRALRRRPAVPEAPAA